MASYKLQVQKAKVPLVCGVHGIQFDPQTGKEETVVKYIYKTWFRGEKYCLWATLEDLYKYNLQPTTQTIDEWDDTFVGFLWNGYNAFLAPAFNVPENPNPLPLDEEGAIPEEE